LGSGLEGIRPSLAQGTIRRDDKAIVFHAEIYGVAESALLDQRLGYAQTSGISDSDQGGSHSDYIVLTVRSRPQVGGIRAGDAA
jgi:hypothetical protein